MATLQEELEAFAAARAELGEKIAAALRDTPVYRALVRFNAWLERRF